MDDTSLYFNEAEPDQDVRDYALYKFVCKEVRALYDLTEEVFRTSAKYTVVDARMYAYYLLDKYTNYSCRDIAKKFATPNHSKVHRLISKLKEYRAKNRYRETILRTLDLLEERVKVYLKEPKIADIIQISPQNYPACILIKNSDRIIYMKSPNQISMRKC